MGEGLAIAIVCIVATLAAFVWLAWLNRPRYQCYECSKRIYMHERFYMGDGGKILCSEHARAIKDAEPNPQKWPAEFGWR